MNRLLAALVLAASISIPAQAHFIWIVPAELGAKVVFSEDLQPDADVPIDKIAATKLFFRDAKGKTMPLAWKKAEHAYDVALPKQEFDAVGGQCVFGVLQRGQGKPFLLAYHPKWVRGDVKNAKPWSELPLEIVQQDGKKFRVLFEGKPAVGAEVVVAAPDDSKQEKTKTDAQGEFALETLPGLYGLRARHIVAKTGEHEGKKYEEVRHYATLVFRQAAKQPAGTSGKGAAPRPILVGKEATYPKLPRPASSLGAAVAGDWVYVYGGHDGKPHRYSTDNTLGTFHRLKTTAPQAWEELPSGPAFQGLALVAYKNKLYRIGGMQPRNKTGEKQDLHSLTSCACYDPASKQWQPMPDLPLGRSSHDAVVIDDKIIVVGGWKLNGTDKKPDWHDTALILDLKKLPLRWEVVPQPFQRRALTAAVHAGKVFVVGGIVEKGDIALTVNVFDPAKSAWSVGPAVPGIDRYGFSPAACEVGSDLYVSTGEGKIWRLSVKGDSWDDVGTLKQARIVHRLVPVSDHGVMALGGSVDGISVSTVEVVDVAASPAKK